MKDFFTIFMALLIFETVKFFIFPHDKVDVVITMNNATEEIELDNDVWGGV